MYAKILIERVMESTERGEKQCGLRKDRSCSGQILAVRQLCEKMKKVDFVAFMDLELAYTE